MRAFDAAAGFAPASFGLHIRAERLRGGAPQRFDFCPTRFICKLCPSPC